MCGLVGAFRANNALFPLTIKAFITQGLYVSALRGMSGTGIALVNKDFSPDMVKSHVDAGNFIFTDKFEWVERNSPDSRAIIGHTRAPTGTAGASSKNAHPFWYGDSKKHNTIIGAHNGHIHNYTSLTPVGFTHPVDSAHAFYSICINGALPTLEKIQGYYVLIWYNEEERTFNIARNTHRELVLARNKAKTVMYYASEEAILRFALERTNQEWDKEHGFLELEPHQIYSWELESPTIELANIYKYNEKKEKAVAIYPGGGMGSGGFRSKWVEEDRSKTPMTHNTPFFAHIKNPDKSWQPYSDDGPWGKVYGTRIMDQGLVVIDGVKKTDWDEKWSKLWQAVPVKCTSSFYETHGEGAAKKTYPSYKATIDIPAAEKDYQKWLKDNEDLESLEKKGPPVRGTVKPSASLKIDSDSVAEILMVKGPGRIMIPIQEWRQIAKEGCVICHGTIIEADVGEVMFYEWSRNPEDKPEDSEHLMICPTCVQNPDDIQKALGYIPV